MPGSFRIKPRTYRTGPRYSGLGDMGMQIRNSLKIRLQAHEATARRPDGVSGEQTGKVDNVEAVIHVLKIDLQTHGGAIALVEVGADRSVERKLGPHSPAAEIQASDHRRAVLRQRLCRGAFEQNR